METEVNNNNHNKYTLYIYTIIADKPTGYPEYLNSIQKNTQTVELAVDTAANIISFSDIRLFNNLRLVNK